jgi:hypothetical protein
MDLTTLYSSGQTSNLDSLVYDKWWLKIEVKIAKKATKL